MDHHPPPVPPSLPDDPAPGLVRFIASAIGFGILLGLTIIATALWMVVTLQEGKPPSEVPDTSGPAFAILIGGTLLGALAALLASWSLLAPLGSPYRRGMLATVSSFATFAAMLVAIPVHHGLGRTGLVGLAVVSAAGCFWLGRGLTRQGRTDGGRDGSRERTHG